MQNIISSFWGKWTQCYFPSLMLQHKWHHQKRNMKIGDIVIIQDKNLVRGEWRLGRVSTALSDDNGIVGNVDVQSKHKESTLRPLIVQYNA